MYFQGRLILLMSAMFAKNQRFLAKIVSFWSVFVRWKVTIKENITFTDYASAIRL